MGSPITHKNSLGTNFLGGRFGYFIFFCSGERKGGGRGEREGGGFGFVLKMPGGGGLTEGGGDGEGSGSVSGELGGGGLNIFFRGRNVHQVFRLHAHLFHQKIKLKTLISLNKEARPFFLSDNSIWSHPSFSSLSDYSIWRS